VRFDRWLRRHSGAISAAVSTVLVLNRRARAHEFVLDSMSRAIPPFLPPAMVELRRLVSRCVSPARNPPRSRVRHLRWPLSDEREHAKKLLGGVSTGRFHNACPPTLRSSSMAAGGAFVPIQPAPFVFPTFPIDPASHPPSAEWTCPHLPEHRRSLPRRRGRCAGDHVGWKHARGEVARWHAAERTPALFGTALLSMGAGAGVRWRVWVGW